MKWFNKNGNSWDYKNNKLSNMKMDIENSMQKIIKIQNAGKQIVRRKPIIIIKGKDYSH
jgi:hypothetical protein